MIYRLLFVLYFCGNSLFGQHCSDCVFTTKSQNGQYFLKTVPFDNDDETNIGKTEIFNSDSVKLYEIPQYFEIKSKDKQLILSNNGAIVAYVMNIDYYKENVYMELFKNGKNYKSYGLNDLTYCADESGYYCSLLFNETDLLKMGFR